jgi:hypothetical protein
MKLKNFVMQLKVIENLLFPSYIRNGIANSISFLHRVKKQISLFISRQKFYFQRQLHGTKIQYIFTYQNIIINNLITERHFLPSSLRHQWVSLPKT